MSMRVLTGFSIVFAAAAAPASADIFDEVRVGVLQHNICVNDCKNADKEDGPTLEGELVFNTPDAIAWALDPRPYLIASVNMSGDTSYAGAGLLWTFNLTDRWALEPSLGYVIHDGEKNNPFANSTPEAAAFFEENVLLGSRDLFRSALALNYDINDTWGMQLQYEHLSHGQILGEGRNQGLDSIGVRAMYRF